MPVLSPSIRAGVRPRGKEFRAGDWARWGQTLFEGAARSVEHACPQLTTLALTKDACPFAEHSRRGQTLFEDASGIEEHACPQFNYASIRRKMPVLFADRSKRKMPVLSPSIRDGVRPWLGSRDQTLFEGASCIEEHACPYASNRRKMPVLSLCAGSDPV